MEVEKIWNRGLILARAFEEYKCSLKDVYSKAEHILKMPSCLPDEFRVSMEEVPDEFFYLRKNIFSTLFQSVYHLLGICEERRLLYAELNHLFRIWVTSADNLLDKENKIVMPLKLRAGSGTMHQVISIMLADRILKWILDTAVERKIIPPHQSRLLSDKSLQILLPSAAEEASEENGVEQRPEPGYVLYTIHRLKTGILFHIPLLGPETVEEDIDAGLIEKAREALDKFGLGCQLLDDIRDMAKDYLEKRHNYLLSMIYREDKVFYRDRLKKLTGGMDSEAKIFAEFPEVVYPAAQLAKGFLYDGLIMLDKLGLGVGDESADIMALSMFHILGVGELVECADIKRKITVR